MKLPVLLPENLPRYENAFARVRPGMHPQWGKLTAHGMLVHLRVALEVSLGETEAPDMSNFFLRLPFMPVVVFEIMPWPKGKIKAPDVFTPTPEESFEADRDKLLRAAERFAPRAASEPSTRTPSPIFRTLPLSYWAKAHAIHTTWHLKQFGVPIP